MSLPNSYVPASCRCVTKVDDVKQNIGVGFDLEDGSVVRLALPLLSAVHVASGILSYYSGYLSRCQLQISSGNPSIDVSVPHDVEVVYPPETSSTACCGVE